MTISEVVIASLAMMGKSDSASDYAACKNSALEIVKSWSFSVKRLYLLYCDANKITPLEFEGYTLNDSFAYGEHFAPAASAYAAMLLSPKTERYKDVYDSLMNDICLMCGAESGHIAEKHTV